MPSYFSLWIATPPGYPHSRCFEEAALGANLLPRMSMALPDKLILYNLEQVQPGSNWFMPE